jgi:hypothetical protein
MYDCHGVAPAGVYHQEEYQAAITGVWSHSEHKMPQLFKHGSTSAVMVVEQHQLVCISQDS